MKKSLLFFAVLFVSISSFCQSPGVALSTIAYTSPVADLSGKTFTPQSPFTAAPSGAIFVANSNYTGTDYWDLSSYKGIEIKLTTTDADNIGKVMADRFVMVGNGAAQSIVKTFNFTSTSQVVKLDFTADASYTNKLWAIKIPFDVPITATGSITIDYLNAVTTFTTGVKDVNASADPNELVKVYDVTGRLIHSNVKRAEIMSQLKNGLYIVGGKKVFINHK